MSDVVPRSERASRGWPLRRSRYATRVVVASAAAAAATLGSIWADTADRPSAKAPESSGTQLNPFDERAFVGVPVAPFPRWMVCPACQYLGPSSSDLFELKTFPYRPDKTCYVHKNCRMPGKTPVDRGLSALVPLGLPDLGFR